MKYFYLLFFLVLLASCDKDDDEPSRFDNNEFESSIDPFVLKAGETTQIPIQIHSSETGFSATVFLIAEKTSGDIYTFHTTELVMPYFNFEKQSYFGAYKEIPINSNDTTITIGITPRQIYNRDDKISCTIYIRENYPVDPGEQVCIGCIGEEYATTYCTMAFESPIFETFKTSTANKTPMSIEMSVDEFKLSTGVVSKITYGLCCSTSQNPTIDNKFISTTTNNEVYTDTPLTTFNDGDNAIIENLQPNTKYYFRPFADNGKVSYGEEFEITTPGIVDYMKNECLEFEKEYLADDGLTVIMNSITKNVADSYIEYIINYTTKNNTSDQEITPATFTMYSLTGDEKESQTGFFNFLFPGESETRSFSFKVLKSKKYHLIEYNNDFFSTKPEKSKLKWGLFES
jgi:hypothetical protein